MPRLPLFFARRYLFSKKSHSVINIVSGVSAFSVAIPVMAMVILLSVFNGFEGLIKSMYRSFDPDIRITPVRGKVFPIDSLPRERFLAIDGVRDAAYALEDNAVFEYRDRQAFGTMCGVDSLYRQVVPLDSLRTEGVFQLQFGDFPEAYVGQGMAYALGIRVNLNSPISVYVPRRGRVSPLLPYSFYKKQNIFPSGVFALEAEVDGKYVIVPLHFAQELLDYSGTSFVGSHPSRSGRFAAAGAATDRAMARRRLQNPVALPAKRVVLPHHDVRKMGDLFHHPAGTGDRFVFADRFAGNADHRKTQGFADARHDGRRYEAAP